MQVIPVINCPDFGCVREKIEKAKDFGANWVHIDVADGRFSKTKTWRNPEELDSLGDEIGDLNFEVHLMVEEPAAEIEGWLRHGVARVILHAEVLGDSWEIICDKIEREDRELGLAVNPETPVRVLSPYLKAVSLVQLLAVAPGPAGQEFNPAIIEKLKELKQREPDLKIEVDGGINLEVARAVKKAGAEIIVSASYIWDSKNPGEAFRKLVSV